MELSHFMVLNYFFHLKGEKTPAQLAKTFRVTKGAITNTLNSWNKRVIYTRVLTGPTVEKSLFPSAALGIQFERMQLKR